VFSGESSFINGHALMVDPVTRNEPGKVGTDFGCRETNAF
jgi:hypothetical protein